MTGELPGVADPFGATIGERIWRRLGGAAAAVVPATGLVILASELLPWVQLGALVVYVLGVPASWLVTRRGGAPVPRHAQAAVVIAIPVAALLAIPTPSFPAFWMIFTAIALGTGVPLAAWGASAGTALPARWVRPVAVLGLVVAFIALPIGVWQLTP